MKGNRGYQVQVVLCLIALALLGYKVKNDILPAQAVAQMVAPIARPASSSALEAEVGDVERATLRAMGLAVGRSKISRINDQDAAVVGTMIRQRLAVPLPPNTITVGETVHVRGLDMGVTNIGVQFEPLSRIQTSSGNVYVRLNGQWQIWYTAYK